MGKIKLVFFDMEGTIFRKTVKTTRGNSAPSAWYLLTKELGKKAFEEAEKNRDRWTSGEIKGYVEWIDVTIELFKKHGLKRDFFEKVMNSIEYHPGVRETFSELRKRGYLTAIISGGFKSQADRAQKDLKIDHTLSACEIFWNNDGTIDHWNSLPSDYEGKVKIMKLLMDEHGLKSEHCAFVGDGKNDVFLAKKVGTSIALNAPEELQRVSTHSINQPEGKEDFRDILKYLK
ncbi:MAG: HAD family phosphatase [Candidatus Aenigmarchaeota archaeon]|nr:HAD family phosphatase [Candidatus Aenigmarchaeota archaeon]